MHRYRNHTGHNIALGPFVYANGKGCTKRDLDDFVLRDGYYVVITFYRSINHPFSDRYRDMYLDYNSKAYTYMYVNGKTIYVKFDSEGNTIFGYTEADIGEY